MTLRTIDIRGDRFYIWQEKERYVSVTTAIGVLPKKKLQDWKDRKIIEDYRTYIDDVANLKPGDALDFIRRKDVSTSADTGNLVHRYMEDIAKGNALADGNDTTSPFYAQVHQFMDDYRPTFVESEAAVFSREWGYAGRIDLIVSLGGRNYVLDIKTGKAVYSEVGLQLSAYRNADFIGRPDGREDALPDCDRQTGLVLHVRPEKYELRTVDIGPRVYQNFLSTLDVFNWSRTESDGIVGEVLPIGDW